ncbi:hypothetical protein KBTX_02380 [wastewater metagenome]|uniref:Uncharacterized protein n=2 Tax=unclassified sequences TaxID=12908 RepID=A0A5B8RBN8_9ZZZZ|nr:MULTISPECIES: C4-dicarboxylate TRAP transporter substrate-binding protein [Arhodomonas]MCS4503062.1 C4-dicarboxylate TRAP transporter substrate-binding protein [Arhodomonas aquaeolei]QEA06051.1 hypothetical protein KBTEX_02380 [uncultured organism]
MRAPLIALSLGLATALTATAAVGQTEFTANSFYSAGSPLSKYGFIEWSKLVKEMSGGDLQPDPMIGTALLEPRASLEGVQKNIAQVATMPAMYTPSEMPVANSVQQLGFTYSDPLATIFAVTDFSVHNQTQLQEWKDLGIVYLGGYATPPYILMCRMPVHTLDQIKGKRIRTAGSAVSQWVESVGGIPVNVPSSEMYTGLDRGTLDCASNAGNDLVDRSLWEVAKHVTPLSTGLYYAGPHWGYNADFWASLTPEQRHTLMKATAYNMADMTIHYMANVDSAEKTAREKGVEFHEASEGLQGSADEFSKKVVEMAYDQAETTFKLSNPKEVIDDFRATHEKWKKLLKDVDRDDPEALAKLAMKEIYGDLDPEAYGVY